MLALGGAAGTISRYGLSRWVDGQPWSGAFPWGTWVVNVTGSFLLAVVVLVVRERLPPGYDHWYLLLGTGFCGGYTTFSTFEWETYALVRDGSWLFALLNVVGSVVAGFGGIVLAVVLVQLLFPRA